jgi:hypothetical protein
MRDRLLSLIAEWQRLAERYRQNGIDTGDTDYWDAKATTLEYCVERVKEEIPEAK